MKALIFLAALAVLPVAQAADLDLNDINVPAATNQPASSSVRNPVYQDKAGVNIRVYAAYAMEGYKVDSAGPGAFTLNTGRAKGVDYGGSFAYQPRLSPHTYGFAFERQTHGFGTPNDEVLNVFRPKDFDQSRELMTLFFLYQPMFDATATGKTPGFWEPLKVGIGYRLVTTDVKETVPRVAITPKNIGGVVLMLKHQFPLSGDRWRLETSTELFLPNKFKERTSAKTGNFQSSWGFEGQMLIGWEMGNTVDLLAGARWNYMRNTYNGPGHPTLRPANEAEEITDMFQFPVMLSFKL